MLGDNLAQGYSKNLRIESECKEEKKEVKKADTDQKILEDQKRKTQNQMSQVKASCIRNKNLQKRQNQK